jgi:predicted alpha/beta-hydrolase family hydrolase
MATMLAVERRCRGVLCFGYPFHPPGKPDKTRLDHLPAMQAPLLICQGERDPFGTHADVAGYTLPGSVQLHWLKDGNHDLAPRRSSGLSKQDNIRQSAETAGKWVAAR